MVERRVSTGYSQLERADMAVGSGLEDAGNLLLHLFTHFPDSATYWEPSVADTGLPGTVFLFQDRIENTLAPYEGLYIHKIATNLYDYISPSVNPTILRTGDLTSVGSSATVLLGNRVNAPDLFAGMGAGDSDHE